MIKHKINVPPGIQYISEWSDYELPRGQHCIVDKGVTGCGYTEFALTNFDNLVLCSPRKLLLENKSDQHQGDPNILYLENTISEFSGVQDLELTMARHINFCTFKCLPIKIMVTYDSLHYVSDYLKRTGLSQSFIFVVDEMQSLFLDSYFKSSTELDFVETLQGCQSVIYLSATPMLDEYLEMLPEFKDLDFYKLDWSKTGYVENIKIQRKRVASLGGECGKIIEDYKAGNYPISLDANKNPVQSKEAVFYFNSVSDIIRTAKKHGLTPQNTLIICSETPDNVAKLKKIGFSIGKVPLNGEPYPEFLFCTSAIYMGIDFYSTQASSFVFADPNIESLALDISLDLPQIIGRQRNKSNPFKNNIVVFYKTKRKDERDLTEEEFKKTQAQRKKSTEILLSAFSKMSGEEQNEYLRKLKESIGTSQYSFDFVSISKNTNMPVYNSLIEIANERAWKVCQKDYQDSLTVTKALSSLKFEVENYNDGSDLIVSDFLDNYFYQTGVFSEKMRLYCEFMDSYSGNQRIENLLDAKIEDPKYKKYYEFFGSSGCKALGYTEAYLLNNLKVTSMDDEIKNSVVNIFKVGEKYAKSDIKIKLKEIYKNLGLSKTAKATDIGNYFKYIRAKVVMGDKSVREGFKLIEII